MPPEIVTKVEAFFASYPKRNYRKGQVLIQAGENPPGVFYLTKGSVREYDIAPSGEEVVVNVFKPLSFFPMSYAINRTPNEFFFEASEDITIQRAALDATRDFVKNNPDVAYDLLRRVYLGTDGLLRRQAHLMGGTAMSRLMYELIVACRRFGETEAGDEYFIAIHESELASLVGMTRETVNRQLHKLKAMGEVEIVHGGVMIKDLAKLEQKLGNNL